MRGWVYYLLKEPNRATESYEAGIKSIRLAFPKGSE